MKRKEFIQLTTALTGISLLQHACNNTPKISGGIVGSSSNIGHILRTNNLPKPSKIINIDVAIIGGGVSGLSAARWLHKRGYKDFLLFDLEKNVGGNSSFSSNQISSYPWGAHYVPLPNNNLKEYIDFLQEANCITGFENNLPIYNEEHLCAEPQERLFINGMWQNGLVPNYGIDATDKKQFEQFFTLMENYKQAKGKDGKFAFDIPVENSSRDDSFISLDAFTMKDWLIQNEFTSSYLHNYVNYCTKDDFGTEHKELSAWVGIHYFAARKGKAANANNSDVLTWQEGNGYLVKQLHKDVLQNIVTNHLTTSITLQEDRVCITVIDVRTNVCINYITKQCIVSTPQFVNTKLMPWLNKRKNLVTEHLHYTPWLVANLLVSKLEEKNGADLSWDNVIYGGKALGYTVASHQLSKQDPQFHNITYYLPLSDANTKEARVKAQATTYEQWKEIVFNDLQIIHPNIKQATKHLDVMIWGHAMAKPLVGVVSKTYRETLQKSIENKIHFAHTDLAGISIFEEAFYMGIKAAKKVLVNHA